MLCTRRKTAHIHPKEAVMAIRRLFVVVALAAVATLLPAGAAMANTAPNPYTPAGSAWVNVPVGERVYFENFGSTYDDSPIYYVGAGITCTYSAIVATGPFLTGQDLDDTNCVDGAAAPIDPIDDPTRAGTTPFGFPVNFFGTSYTGAYPSTNGGIFFDSPNADYDETLASLADASQSSAMFPLGADLYYEPGESNLWVAQTTVDGLPAVVFTWEKFHTCCDSSPSLEDMSFQLVLMNVGGGDFNAWFNYGSFANFDEGYEASTALVNLLGGVTVGSNVITAADVSGVPTVCTQGDAEAFGTPTDSQFASDLAAGYFYKVDNVATRAISVWSDAACTVPINVNAVQDEATDLTAYLQLVENSLTSYFAIAVGWSTYDLTTAAIDSTELLFNVNSVELVNGAPNPLINRSFNTTVPGRFVIGQRGGATVTDPALLATAAAPGLAATGTADFTWTVSVAGALLLAGAALIWVRTGRRTSVPLT
jgi:hypothetical protein